MRETLDLNIDQALRQVDRLEQALKRATSSAATVSAPVAPPRPTTGAGTGGLGTLGGLGAAFASREVFERLTSAINETVMAASDLNEQIAASEVVFGAAAPEVQAFAEGAAAIGLASDQALAAANNFGALFSALGLSQQAAASLGPTLIQRAADLASFRNVAGGTNEVIQRLSSGLVGEVEPLRRLGIAINENVVRQKALAMGAVEVNGALSESAKVQARIALILEQSSLAAGDFARTQDGLANTQRQLAAEFRNLQIELGERFLPGVLAGTRGLREMVELFSSLPGPIQAVIVGLAGLATAAVGIGLAALAVQRLSAALTQAGVAGRTASTALRGLAIGGGILAGLGAAVGILELLQSRVKGLNVDMAELARLSDEALVQSFKDADQGKGLFDRFKDAVNPVDLFRDIAGGTPAGSNRLATDQLEFFEAVARQSIPTAQRLRDELKGQGEDVRELDEILRKETEAQKQVNADAAAGIPTFENLGGAAGGAADQMSTLDKALKATADQMDLTFGRFVDAEQAALGFQDSVFNLGEALGRGAEEGEGLLSFQNRLSESLLGTVADIESYVAAQQRAGKIAEGTAAAQDEIRRQLLLLGDAFPELQDQIRTYLDLLADVPSTVTTKAIFDDAEARGGLFGWVNAIGSALAQIDAAQRADTKRGEHMANVITGNVIKPIATEGRKAGEAAANAALDEIKTTLRRSGTTGFDIGGFLVEGVILGAGEAAVRAKNKLLAEQTGLTDLVNQAAQIDPAEQLEVLRAVEAMDQATKDLAEARETLGADSIEAAIAERALAAAQAKVNETILTSIDATEKINELLDEEKKRMDELTGAIRAASGAYSALSNLEKAREEAAKQNRRLAQFDTRIGESRERLAAIRSSGGAGSLDESRELATLADLERRRVDQVEKTVDANVQVVDSILGLASAGQDLISSLPGWEEFFRGVADAAGLPKQRIDELIYTLALANNAARSAFGQVSAIPLGTVNTAPVATTMTGRTGELTAQGGVSIDQINIYETTSARGTAVEVVDELRAQSLMGSG